MPGYYADFVVLSDNPASVPPASVSDIKVTMTVIGGKIVYE
jgi:predicted amidohydrolase YtcJ